MGFKGRPLTTIHFMQTGYTLNKGEFIYGIGLIEYGFTDRLQVGTDILLTFIGTYYNVITKINLNESRNMAFSTSLGVIYAGKDDYFIVTPILSYSRIISTKLNLHFAGQFRIVSNEIENRSDSIYNFMPYFITGIDFKISNITKLLSETGFDIANNGYYICGGLLFGWENFRLKLGYGYFHPTPVYMGTYPYGLWFRFR